MSQLRKLIGILLGAAGDLQTAFQNYLPGIRYFEQIKKLRILVIVNSDAHKPHELDGKFEYGFSFLKEAGIDEVVYYKGNGWAFESLK